ncbi:hypothetical protein [Rodentibacter genomosp. 2]|nr:hypothetical protein [Rodentibacter genomosp. 2]
MKDNIALLWFLIVTAMTLYDIYYQQGMYSDSMGNLGRLGFRRYLVIS